MFLGAALLLQSGVRSYREGESLLQASSQWSGMSARPHRVDDTHRVSAPHLAPSCHSSSVVSQWLLPLFRGSLPCVRSVVM